jgi:Putative prokaryotic signal transducing protein
MHTVYDAAQAVDAHMVANLLREAGIEAQVFGEFLSGCPSPRSGGGGETPHLSLGSRVTRPG